MKCIKCDKDSGRKDREGSGGKCPYCRHSFVTEPAEDGLTDKAIQTSEDQVSANGLFYFLPAHLKYQILRKTRKKQHIWAWINVSAILCLAVSFAWLARGGNVIAVIIGIAGTIGLITSLAYKSKYKKVTRRIDSILQRWYLVNPHEKLLSKNKSSISQNNRKPNKDLEEISFERVLICEKTEYVDLFLENLFHFHYSCPVLGGSFYPENVCSDMLKRLKRNEKLDVFLLHDYSPEGYVFARRVKNDKRWFGDCPHFNFIDLGLIKEQKAMFKSMMTSPRDSSITSARAVQRNRSNQKIARLTVFRPETLIALCGQAINEQVPLHLVSSKYDNSSGYG